MLKEIIVSLLRNKSTRPGYLGTTEMDPLIINPPMDPTN